ncbi:MAG: dihydroorotase-like protein [Oceanospirillaceae bacterium]|nr:dihydroorotase-like protein [Oceanospirillaceae bacterium]
MKYLHIRNAHLIDPAQELDETSDLYITDGRIAAIGHKPSEGTIDRTIDAQGQWLVPGFVDLSCYLNEPGYSQKGSIARDTHAAAKAGFTHICAQPRTRPVADSSAVIQQIVERSAQANAARVLPLGALTKGLQGEQLSNMVSLRNAGCIALSNARAPIKDSYVLRRLMEYAATYDIRLFITPLDTALAADGVMHEGPTSTRLGLAGIPETAETVALAQILLLAEQTGARVHISQISSARSADMVSDAKARGLKVSADVSLANLCFTARQVNGYNSRFHVEPPLRGEADRQALLAAVNRGELIICSNHRPHEIAAKKAPFAASEPGMSLYNCFLPLLLKLIKDDELDRNAAIKALSTLPAQTLGLDRVFREGAIFNATLINQTGASQSCSEEDLSSPLSEPLPGTASETFVDGQLVKWH